MDESDFLKAAARNIRDEKSGLLPIPHNRDVLGRIVRAAWVQWASSQPNPKASWLVPYDELSEPDKEADRRIGESVVSATGLTSPHESAIIAAAEELIRTGYASTNGLITREALRYRIVGIIARHILTEKV